MKSAKEFALVLFLYKLLKQAHSPLGIFHQTLVNTAPFFPVASCLVLSDGTNLLPGQKKYKNVISVSLTHSLKYGKILSMCSLIFQEVVPSYQSFCISYQPAGKSWSDGRSLESVV